VEAELSNPLSIPLQFTDMKLVCSYSDNNNQEFEIIPFDTLLMPLSVKKVLFGFVSHREGDIEIEGMMFKLCGTVTGKRKFNGDFKVRITSPMPLIEPVFEGFKENLLEGQLHQFHLNIKNNGQKPMSHIAIKMSHPRYLSFDDDLVVFSFNSSNENELLSLTTKKFVFEEPLIPGKSFRIPLWIRGYKTGEHQLRFLFEYSCSEKNELLPARLQRAISTLTVEPSLKIDYTLVPSQTVPKSYLLAINIQNNSEETLSVLQMRCFSSLFKINNPNENGVLLELEKKKSGLFYAHVELSDEKSGTPHQDIVSSQISSEYEDILSKIPSLSYLFRDHLCTRQTQVITHDFEQQDQTPLILRYKNKIHLSLIWKLGDKFGLYNFHDIDLLPVSPWSLEPENCPISFYLKSVKEVTHDFSQGFLIIPLTIFILNQSPFTPISFDFEAMLPMENEELGPSLYIWNGITRYHFPILQPRETTQLETEISFWSPGIYNINRMRFIVYLSDGSQEKKKIVVHSSVEHLISITQK